MDAGGLVALSRGKKLLLGCGVLAGAVILGTLLTVILFVVWLRSPGEPLEGSRLVDPETGFYLEATLRADDPAARDLVRALVSSQRRLPDDIDLDGAPPWLSFVLPAIDEVSRQEVTDEEIDQVLPLSAILTTQRDTVAEPLLAVNCPPTGQAFRFIDWTLALASRWGAGVERRRHRERNIFSLGPEVPAWIAVVENNALISPSPAAVGGGIDRLSRRPEDRAAPPLLELLAGVPADTCIRLAAEPGQTEILLGLLERVAPGLADGLRPRLRGSATTTGWAYLESSDRLVGYIALAGADDLAGSAAPDTRFVLRLHDGLVRVVLEPEATDAAGQQILRFQVEGLEELVSWLGRAGRTGGIVIRP
jgi:hypothetical protein